MEVGPWARGRALVWGWGLGLEGGALVCRGGALGWKGGNLGLKEWRKQGPEDWPEW